MERSYTYDATYLLLSRDDCLHSLFCINESASGFDGKVHKMIYNLQLYIKEDTKVSS